MLLLKIIFIIIMLNKTVEPISNLLLRYTIRIHALGAVETPARSPVREYDGLTGGGTEQRYGGVTVSPRLRAQRGGVDSFV